MSKLTFIKFGGSVLTNKAGREEARQPVIDRLSQELARSRELALSRDLASGGTTSILLGHGSGSFGHRAAVDAGAASGRFTRSEATAATEIQSAARRLHGIVVASLQRAGVAPASFPPAAWCTWEKDALRASDLAGMTGALASGAVPVVMGDVVWDQHGGARIASTEEVFCCLAQKLPIGRVIWVGETDGILDADGQTVSALQHTDELFIGEVKGPDVTGGMALRWQTVQSLAQRGVESWLINGLRSGELSAAMAGDSIRGTKVAAA